MFLYRKSGVWQQEPALVLREQQALYVTERMCKMEQVQSTFLCRRLVQQVLPRARRIYPQNFIKSGGTVGVLEPTTRMGAEIPAFGLTSSERSELKPFFLAPNSHGGALARQGPV